MIETECIVCGGDSYKGYGEWATSNGLTTVRCNSCSFIWTNPRPSDEEINNFYENYTEYRRGLAEELTEKRKVQYIDDRDFVVPFFHGRSDVRVLDFGCHDGLFLNTFDGNVFDRHGIDISPGAVEWAKENLSFGENVHACDILDAPYPDNHFDLIMMRGVIEHLTYPDECMKKIEKLLRKDGMLYFCATPNVDSYSARLFKGRWNQYKPPEHLLYFSDFTLERYMNKFGLSFMAKYFPYESTPYANVGKDAFDIKKERVLEKTDGTVNIPFYNNMMNVVFIK